MPRYSSPNSAAHSRYENKPQPPVPPQSGVAADGRVYSGLPTRPNAGRRPLDPHSGNGNGHGNDNGYGYGKMNTTMSPPPQAAAQRPPAQARPPATSRPPPSPVQMDGNDRSYLLPVFKSVDKNSEFLPMLNLIFLKPVPNKPLHMKRQDGGAARGSGPSAPFIACYHCLRHDQVLVGLKTAGYLRSNSLIWCLLS